MDDVVGLTAEISLDGHPLGTQCPETIKPPLVSFVLRNWNYASYVGTAIDSIKDQDYPRFEVVVVDNGSTDDSRNVIAEHVDDDPRFSIIHSKENLGPLGGALRGLDLVRGEFVTFVDSDDLLLPNFASYHIQVHLAARANVAFTSSDVIEIGADGSIISGTRAAIKRLPQEEKRGLRPAHAVPRLSGVSDSAYERLHAATFNYQPSDYGWFWAPTSANMYRRFILQMLRPVGPPDRVRQMAVDGHYHRLSHLFGGSIFIDKQLSAYRIHENNFFSQSAGLNSLRNGGGPATAFLEMRMCEAIRVLLENCEDRVWRMGSEWRYWSALNQLMQATGSSTLKTAQSPEFQKVMAEYFSQLVEALGSKSTIKNLLPKLGRNSLRNIARDAYPKGVPASIRLQLLKSALFRDRLKGSSASAARETVRPSRKTSRIKKST